MDYDSLETLCLQWHGGGRNQNEGWGGAEGSVDCEEVDDDGYMGVYYTGGAKMDLQL